MSDCRCAGDRLLRNLDGTHSHYPDCDLAGQSDGPSMARQLRRLSASMRDIEKEHSVIAAALRVRNDQIARLRAESTKHNETICLLRRENAELRSKRLVTEDRRNCLAACGYGPIGVLYFHDPACPNAGKFGHVDA